MSKKETSTFKVQDIQDEDIWLRDLGGGPGLAVAVERSAPDYSDEIREKIHTLSVGDQIKAELESQNDLHTVWHFTDIQYVEGSSEPTKELHA